MASVRWRGPLSQLTRQLATRLTKPLAAAFALLALFCTWAAEAHAEDRLARILLKGEIAVGVKKDYPPFGMLDEEGNQAGFEYDLAQDIAHRLGVRLRTVGVSGANRLQQLAEGRVDLVLATMADTEERRAIATVVEPDYYASGVTLMAPADTHIETWTDLRGQSVCATQGSYFNRPLEQVYLAHLQLYNNGRDARMALRDRRCVGWVFDNTAIAGDLMQSQWQGYKAALPPQWVTPWAIAVGNDAGSAGLARFLGDTVAQWHRDGFLLDVEKKWGLPPSEFLAREHDLWNEQDGSGQPRCRRQADGDWPASCLNQAYVSAAKAGGLRQWGLLLKESSGVDMSFFYDDYERTHFVDGLATTLALTVCCVAGSLLVGCLLALLCESGLPWLGGMIGFTAQIVRMTPPLLQMYIVLFGIGSFFAARWNLHFAPFGVACFCLCGYTGAMVMQVLLNAAHARRLAEPHFRIRPRNLLRLTGSSSTPISASLVNVAKGTMLAGAISVPELLSASTAQIAEHGNPSVVMNVVMLFYLALIYLLIRVLTRLGRLAEGGAHGTA